MRLLPKQQQTAITDSICSYLQHSTKFLLPDCALHIQVIPGESEGLYGWIAANYLLGGFDPSRKENNHGHSTFGFLDMGGASAQIAFAPNATESEKHANDLKLLRMRNLLGQTLEYKLFVTTWLGYGVHEARRRYVENLLKANDGSAELPDPCLPSGLKVTQNGDVILPGSHEASGQKAPIIGTASFTECMKQTFTLLDKDAPCEDEPCLFHGIHTPAIDFDINHFVGVSEFWYTTHGVFSSLKDQAYDFHTYQKKVDEFCSQDWAAVQSGLKAKKWGEKIDESDVVEICFKASWVINMLHNGIGVPRVGLEPIDDPSSAGENGTEAMLDATKPYKGAFRAVNKIDNVEVSWTLGRMVMYAASEVPGETDALAVGFGSNIPGNTLPDDFQPGGLVPTQRSKTKSDWHDKLFESASQRRVPGLVIFLIILLLAAYLLCGRDRRQAVLRRIATVFGVTRYSPLKSGKRAKQSWAASLFGTETSEHRAPDEEVELGLVTDSSDSDDASPVALSSPSRKRNPGLMTFPSRGTALLDQSLSVRVESREKLVPSPSNVSGSRSRNASPTRRSSPKVLPFGHAHKTSRD